MAAGSDTIKVHKIISTIFFENTYVLVNTKTSAAIIIDPGRNTWQRIQQIIAADIKIEAIFITHAHFDHVRLTPEQRDDLVPLVVAQAVRDLEDRLQGIRGLSAERIHDELIKLIMGAAPRLGLSLLVETGLAEYVLPELPKLKLEVDEHHHHKDVYEHTLKVLEQTIALEDRLGGPNLIIRLAALLHDIGKPKTRELIPGGGVSFHHHEVVGSKMASNMALASSSAKYRTG